MNILVTGAAGFIGSRLALQLARRGDEVTGIDNLNDYYDVRMKHGRMRQCGLVVTGDDVPWGKVMTSVDYPNYSFVRMALEDNDSLQGLFTERRFDVVVNLAAQAGVRYSITNPYAYVQSNVVGFLNVLEACRHHGVNHLVFASSSSVYGLNGKVPFEETDMVDMPVSLYAATKKSNELMAHSYAKLYGIPMTGLRYFTVYGPWGRPDMAPMLFAKAITRGEPIKVFNNGNLQRDFTYIDDIVTGTMRVVDHRPDEAVCPNGVPYRIYNIGCSKPVHLMDFIGELELALGREAKKVYLPMQQGDVYQTYASTARLEAEVGYKPVVSLHEGIGRFVEWYKSSMNPLRDL